LLAYCACAPRLKLGLFGEYEDGKTCFFVSDNDIGIAEEFHDLVFELFERLGLRSWLQHIVYPARYALAYRFQDCLDPVIKD